MEEGILMYDYQFGYQHREDLKKKKELFRISNSAGLSCILFFVFSISVSYIALFVARLISNNYTLEVVEDFYLNLDYILGTFIPIPISFFIFAKINGMKVSSSLPLTFKNKKKILLTLSVASGVIIVMRFAVTLFSLVMESFGWSAEVPEIVPAKGLGGIVVMTVVVTLMTGLVEEFAFRGLLLTALRKYGDTFAVVVSSALFGLLHRNPVSVFSAFLLGLVMGYAVIITNSMWTSVIIHTLNNLQAIAFAIMPLQVATIFSAAISLLMIVIGITGIVILIVYRKKVKQEITLEQNSILSLADRTSTVIMSPMIWLLLFVVVFFDPIMNLLNRLMLNIGI